MMKTSILITGSSGFIGAAALRHLQAQGFDVCPVFRSPASAQAAGWDASKGAAIVPELSAQSDWAAVLAGVEVVLHCAARAHIMRDEALDPLAEYRRVNVQGTLRLAEQAAAAGVRRFVFLSSIGVNGTETVGTPFDPDDTPNPQDSYAQSKWEAEQELQKLASQSGMELVIIRPPLVYGANAPGNFGRLLEAVRRGKHLPLGAIHNRRTLVGLDNLTDFIRVCLIHPRAAGQVFLVSDAEDISTSALLRQLGLALGRPARLLPIPLSWMLVAASVLGKRALVRKVCGDLQVNISKNHIVLGWSPPVSVEEGLRRAVQKET